MSPLNRAVLCGLVVLCGLSGTFVQAAEPAPMAGPPEGWLWQALPYPALVLDSYKTLPDAELRAIAYTALPRLAIDDETVEANVAEDIALLFRASVAVQLLESRGQLDAELRIVARTFAYYLERVGRAYAESATVRDTFDRLPSLVPEGSRPVALALSQSLGGARAYAARWFPRALAAEGPSTARGVAAWNQLGLIAHGTERLEDAATAFGHALALKPPLQVLVNAFAAFTDLNTKESLALAQKVRTEVLATDSRLDTRFSTVERKIADRRVADNFRAKHPELTPVETVAMGDTLMRVGDRDAAEALAREALGRYKDDPGVWYMAAAILQQNGRKESLKLLYQEASAMGRLDDRLREFRLTALIDARITAGFGGVAPLRDDALLASELAWLAGRSAHHAFLAAVAEFVIELATYTTLKPDDAATKIAAEAVKKRALKIAEAHKDLPDAWRVAVTGAVATSSLASGDIGVLKKIPRGGGAAMAAVRANGARLEAAYAMRARDLKRMAAAAKSLAAADKDLARLRKSASESDKTDLEHEAAMNGLMSAQLNAMQVVVPAGGPGALKDADKKRWQAAVATLETVSSSFDETYESGRRFVQAVSASRAAILEGLGRLDDADIALRAMRRIAVSPFLSNVAASKLLERRKIIGDAVDFMGRALGADVGVHGEQYGNLRLSQLYAVLGQADDARAAAAAALGKWDAAGLPDKLFEGSLRALIVSELGVSLSIEGDKPLALLLSVEPVVALVPEIAADKAALEKAQKQPAAAP